MTKMTEQTNPLREGLSTRAVPQPCAIVIFGATGDLSRRKLLPGLAHLALSELAPDIQVIGTSLEDLSEEEFRNFAKAAVTEFSHHPLTEEQWQAFAERVGAADAVAVTSCTTALQLALYESASSEAEVLASYDAALATRGYRPLATEVLGEATPVPARVYMREMRDGLVVLATREKDKTVVSTFRVGIDAHVDLTR